MYICLFDIDGTLLSSGGAGKTAMEVALAAEFGVPPSSNDVPFAGRTDRVIARDLLRSHGLDDSSTNWQRFLTAYLRLLPGCLANSTGRVLPGIAALLEALRSRDDVTLGLLTGNVRDGARLKLGHYGIFEYFAFGGFGDHHLSRDDVARDALAAAHGHVKGPVSAERIWVIGDTPFDIQCARSIGARAVAVATGLHSCEILAAVEPDLVLADFSDAEPLLRHFPCQI
jgi:phosphoglycolate phosphatase-like HAD superfamily hydrolase